MHQLDIATAFLNGELEKEIFMKQPEGFAAKGQEHLVCKLNRSIYDLKQSPRCWNSVLDDHLNKIGFKQTTSDLCLYVATEGEMFIIAVYVDDILQEKAMKEMTEIKRALSKRFDVKDMGELHYFLGVNITQNQKGDVWIGQPVYTQDILTKFGMSEAKPVSTPVDTGTKLVKATDDSSEVDQGLYQSAVGSLLYLSSRYCIHSKYCSTVQC